MPSREEERNFRETKSANGAEPDRPSLFKLSCGAGIRRPRPNMDQAIVERQPALDKPAYCARIDHVFLGQHAGRQTVFRIVFLHLDRCLRHDGAMIQFGSHEMNSCAMHFHTGVQSLPMRRQTGKAWQERRVNVEHPTDEMLDEGGGENAHETSQYHQVRCKPVDCRLQCGVEGFPRRIILVGNHRRRYSMFSGKSQAFRVRAIADDGCNPRVPPFGFGSPDNGLHVAAPPGNQYDDIFHAANCTVPQ